MKKGRIVIILVLAAIRFHKKIAQIVQEAINESR